MRLASLPLLISATLAAAANAHDAQTPLETDAQEPKAADAQTPQGMVLVPAGEFLMGSDSGLFDEAPAHPVYLSAYYVDRHEVSCGQFGEFVRRSSRYDTIEGPWFRDCAEGCLDVVAHFEKRYGMPLGRFSSTAEHVGERERRDAARWNAAAAALWGMLEGDASPTGEKPIEQVAELPQVRELVRLQAAYPVRNVTWRDAQAYAQWAGKRLPTEAEWEKAARGNDGRVYPWGDTWSPDRCRTGLMPLQSTLFNPWKSQRDASHGRDAPTGPAPVGSYPEAASPYGCLDMAGNVWEWTADWYGENYYCESAGSKDPAGPPGLSDGQIPGPDTARGQLRSALQGRSANTRKVIRGGGWSGPPNQAAFHARTTRRLWSNPSYWHADVGFRCVKTAEADPSAE